ncbi:MAG: flagellar filament capping protein FliD [Motiliproteus sp.]|nr:flagellar filament capping protein FliD [Motiliproteus sp.]MCW9051996.1 flagellar filament capping protein FliD [Motiliproteus sp.]
MSDNIISSLGAGSGINTSQLADDLISIERSGTDEILDNRQQKYESQISGYGALRSAMTSIQDNLSLLVDSDTFNGRNVSFPTTDILTPTSVSAEALAGEYSVEVTALAASHSLSSDDAALYSDADSVVGNGTLTFSFGDWDGGAFTANGTKESQVITIDDSNNTLTGIRDAINSADFGVQAAVINTGSGYQLQMTGPSGANNEIEVVVSEGAPAGLSALAYNVGNLNMDENQTGADAALKVNGLSITRESNQLDDVITGLEFTLNNASIGETVAITITEDKSLGEQTIRDFIEGYNSFLTTAESLTGSDTSDEDASVGSLVTDASAKSMINQVRNSISTTITGLSGNYTALANIGIQTELDGSLSIDEDQFQSSIDNNFSEVVSLFTASSSSSNSLIDIVKVSPTTKAGEFDVVVTTDPAKGDWVADNAISEGTYVAGTDSFSSTLTADGTYTFKVTVDGTSSDTITLTGGFDTAEEVRAKLQSLINGDTNLSGVGAAVDVAFDSATDKFTFTSRSYGSSSNVSVTESGAGMIALGVDKDNGTATGGTDVVGTIDGVDAFGSGNILLPELGSELAGLSLSISPGATAASTVTITHSRGFSNELNNILDAFLANNGLIDTREDTLNDRLDDIEEDREDLDTRMEVRRAQLQAQFIAMEQIIASLNSTSDSLGGLVDRLPFTSSSN